MLRSRLEKARAQTAQPIHALLRLQLNKALEIN
jgi:hypothetical protein